MKKFLPLIIFAILCFVPFVGLSTYVMHILILVLMWSVIGMAWNVLGGYTGQVSFGHAAFFGFGASGSCASARFHPRLEGGVAVVFAVVY